MSRISFHSFLDNIPVEITAGWDHPLQTYWIDIVELYDEDNVIYSSMTMVDGYFSLVNIQEVIKDYQLTVPDTFWKMVEPKAGNIIYHFKDSACITN